jgi:hypothetical protein
MDGFTEDKSFLFFAAAERAERLPLPTYCEIIHQRGETAILDGDAIVSWVFNSARGLDTAHGGQMVHVVELVRCSTSEANNTLTPNAGGAISVGVPSAQRSSSYRIL